MRAFEPKILLDESIEEVNSRIYEFHQRKFKSGEIPTVRKRTIKINNRAWIGGGRRWDEKLENLAKRQRRLISRAPREPERHGRSMMRRSMNSGSVVGSAPCQDDFGSHRGPYSGSTVLACRIFLSRQASRKVRAGRDNADPVLLPFSNRLSYDRYRSLSSRLSLVIIRRVALPHAFLPLPRISFVKISLKFDSIGDQLLSFFFFFFCIATSYSKGRSIVDNLFAGSRATSVCTTESLCVVLFFFFGLS